MVTKKDKYLAAAQKYMERGQLDKALAEFGRVVQEDPKDTRTWLRMAEIHAKRGQNEQAVEIYRRTADIYSEQGFLQKAVAVWKNILKLAPGYLDGYTRLADLFAQLGQLRESTEQLEFLAVAHLRAGRSQEALAAMRRIVELDPDNVISRIKLAEAASQAGAIPDAVREFAIAADQLRTQGRTEDYLRVAERLFFHQPDNLPLARELAETYIIRNNARLALPKLQSCFKADPRDPGTLSLLARAFEQLGQIPKTVSVLKELGKLCHEQGRTVERNRAIRKALSLQPRDPELNEAAERWGIGGEAPRAVSVAAPISPALAPPRRPSSAQVAHSEPSHEEEEQPEQPEQIDGPVSAVEADIARIMAESEVFIKYGLLERAVEHLRRVLDVDASYIPARTKRADVLVDLGRNADAVAELEEAAEAVASSSPTEAAALGRRALALDPRSIRAQRLLQALLIGDEAPAEPSLGATSRLSHNDRVTAPRPVIAAIPLKAAEPEPSAAENTPADEFTDPFASTSSLGGGPPPIAPLDIPDTEDRTEERGLPLAVEEEPVPTGEDALIESPVLTLEAEQPDGDLTGQAGAQEMSDISAAPVIEGTVEDEMVELDSADFQEADELGGAKIDEVTPLEVTSRVALSDTDEILGDYAVPVIGGPQLEVQPPPSGAAEATEQSLDVDLSADLAQIDFFRDQGLWEEALSQLDEMQRRMPENPVLVRKRAELEQAAAATGGVASGPPQATVDDEIDQAFDAFPSSTAQPRAVVDGEVDAATHGDLGIAYKEMGLNDAAIAEFQLLMGDPAREVFALTMIGECHEAKGATAEAIATYKKALASSQVTPAETNQLYYCLAIAFETAGDAKEAMYYMERVVKRDASFRDAVARLDRLKKQA